jgi:hypothetical protein
MKGKLVGIGLILIVVKSIHLSGRNDVFYKNPVGIASTMTEIDRIASTMTEIPPDTCQIQD